MSNAETTKKGLGARFWIILVLVLLLAVGGATGGVLFYLNKKQPDVGLVNNVTTYKIPMGSFTVNLKDNNYKRYLRMEITLETNEKKLIKEIEENNHRARDVVIGELADKTVADLEDREALKIELMNALNAILTKGDVTGIYFDQFMFH